MTKIEVVLGKIRDFFKSNTRIAILVLFILEFMLNIWITPNKYDSEFYIKQMAEMSVFDFVGMRYQTWTSRVLIEFLLGIVLPRYSLVWAILNTIMMTILGYSILKLLIKDDNKSLIWMSLSFILLYPLSKIATCDWGAGSVNYIWPLAMLLFSAIPIKKIFSGEKIKKYMYPLYSVALLFACNQEQACAIAFGVYGIFTILAILKEKRKVHPFLMIQCILIILSLVFIATCPGNYARKNEEIATYYMNFGMLGIFDKFSLGLTSTVNHLLVHTNIVFLVFSLVSAVYIFMKYKNNLYRTTAFIPLVLGLVFGVFKDLACKIFPYFGMFCEMISEEQLMLTPGNYINFINFIPLIMAFVVLGSILLNILLIFKNLKNNIALILYALGVMSRVVLGFSPTVFASTDRTFIFLEFAFIMITILIWQEFLQETDKAPIKARNRLGTLIVTLSALQYMHTLIYVLISQM